MATVWLAGDEFVPTPLQERILEALHGRALHTEDLVQEVGDPHRFFSGQGGFWELRHWGLVVHDARLGNYRPDSPPPEAVAASRPHPRPVFAAPPAGWTCASCEWTALTSGVARASRT